MTTESQNISEVPVSDGFTGTCEYCDIEDQAVWATTSGFNADETCIWFRGLQPVDPWTGSLVRCAGND